MIVSENSGGTFEQAPVGAHVARCIGLTDIGTHHDEYEGKPIVRRQFIMRWELPSELMTEGEYAGQPFCVSEFYTLSLSEKSKLRPMLESWRGKPFTEEELKGFDLQNILGKPCMVQVGRNKKDKAKVLAVMSMPKGMQAPTQVNPSKHFSLDEFDQDAFDDLSDWTRGKIKESDEWAKIQGIPQRQESNGNAPAFDDDIPF